MLHVTTLFSQLLIHPTFLVTMMSKNGGDSRNCSRVLRDLLLFEDTPFSNYSEDESTFGPKLLSCILLGSLDGLIHLEVAHGIAKILMGQLQGAAKVIDRETMYLNHILGSLMNKEGSLSISVPVARPDPFWQQEDVDDAKAEAAKGNKKNPLITELVRALKEKKNEKR